MNGQKSTTPGKLPGTLGLTVTNAESAHIAVGSIRSRYPRHRRVEIGLAIPDRTIHHQLIGQWVANIRRNRRAIARHLARVEVLVDIGVVRCDRYAEHQVIVKRVINATEVDVDLPAR